MDRWFLILLNYTVTDNFCVFQKYISCRMSKIHITSPFNGNGLVYRFRLVCRDTKRQFNSCSFNKIALIASRSCCHSLILRYRHELLVLTIFVPDPLQQQIIQPRKVFNSNNSQVLFPALRTETMQKTWLSSPLRLNEALKLSFRMLFARQ